MMLYLVLTVFMVSAVPAARADAPVHGHYAVTLPKNCDAVTVLEKEGDSAPALHYLPRAYERCMELSRDILSGPDKETATLKDKNAAPPLPDAVKVPISERPVSRNYYRVTPQGDEK